MTQKLSRITVVRDTNAVRLKETSTWMSLLVLSSSLFFAFLAQSVNISFLFKRKQKNSACNILLDLMIRTIHNVDKKGLELIAFGSVSLNSLYSRLRQTSRFLHQALFLNCKVAKGLHEWIAKEVELKRIPTHIGCKMQRVCLQSGDLLVPWLQSFVRFQLNRADGFIKLPRLLGLR